MKERKWHFGLWRYKYGSIIPSACKRGDCNENDMEAMAVPPLRKCCKLCVRWQQANKDVAGGWFTRREE